MPTTIRQIPISEIDVGSRLRELDTSKVEEQNSGAA